MSAKTVTSIELKAEEVALLDKIKAEAGAPSRSAVLRMALGAYENYRRAARSFVEAVRDRFDADAYMVVELDHHFDAFASVDGERQDDIYVPIRHITFDGEDFVEVFIGDPHPTSTVRILLGMLPLRSGVPLAFPLRELTPDMRPKAVAYFPNS